MYVSFRILIREKKEFKPILGPLTIYFILIIILEVLCVIGYFTFVLTVTWVEWHTGKKHKVVYDKKWLYLYNLINTILMIGLNLFALYY
jgi:hypothetical protein